MDIKKYLKQESRPRLFMAFFIVLGAVFILFFTSRDSEYLEEIDREIILAHKVCEASLPWILNNPESLKRGKNSLKHIKVDGETVHFKHIKPPVVLFHHSGFVHPGALNEFYCTFYDPRKTPSDSYYSYEERSWVDKEWADKIRIHR